MNILFLLVPVALVVIAVALKLFFWAVKSGQYDDLDTEAHRILFDDDEPSADQSLGADKRADQTDEPDR